VRRPRLTYANVVSSIALFIALGGTGYAVTKLPRNSVGNRQLKANAVTSGKIRRGAVQSSDLAPTARSASRGPRGPEGPVGAAGPTGPSETIQVKHPEAVLIPVEAGGTVTLAAVAMPAGSWLFNAQTRIVYAGTGTSEFFDCFLSAGTPERLGEGTLNVGEAPAGDVAGSVPTQIAATFAAPTQVTYVCTHPTAVAGTPRAERTWLIATRVGSLEDR
jgi:hypothetical protein